MAGLDIAILDYRAGNVASVAKAFRYLGAAPRITARAGDLEDAAGIVVPGVGHFARTAAIDFSARRAITAAASRGVPVLGICLGLHWFCAGSDESSDALGLGVIADRCIPLPSSDNLKVPHIGWNALERTGQPTVLLEGIDSDAHAYFCHSYAIPPGPGTTAVTRHGESFSAVVEQGRFYGVQFHPEKSGEIGLRILSNFLYVCREGR